MVAEHKRAWANAARATEATARMADEEKSRVARIEKLLSVKHLKTEGKR